MANSKKRSGEVITFNIIEDTRDKHKSVKAINANINPETTSSLFLVSQTGQGFDDLNKLCRKCGRGTVVSATVKVSDTELSVPVELPARLCVKKSDRMALCVLLGDSDTPLKFVK